MQNNKFKILIEHASSCLGKSDNKIKDTYKGHPICLMEYIEKDVPEHVIEIRFDNQGATISLYFDDKQSCNTVFLFFDSTQDEDSFIDYLTSSANYSYKCSRWELPKCFVKVSKRKEDVYLMFYPK